MKSIERKKETPWCLTANEASVLTAHSRKRVSDLSTAVDAAFHLYPVSVQQAGSDRRIALIPAAVDQYRAIPLYYIFCGVHAKAYDTSRI
nr:hypothetical protein BaRGS_020008 [Batillaria attramentaria]